MPFTLNISTEMITLEEYKSLESEMKVKEDRITTLEELFSAAKDFIDKSPGDPDVYDHQIVAWLKYLDLLAIEESINK